MSTLVGYRAHLANTIRFLASFGSLVWLAFYEKSGTHRAIRMPPDDDMKLAKLLKRHRFRQGVAYGAGLISVEWHQTLPDAVRGLSKSMFSGLDYGSVRRRPVC